MRGLSELGRNARRVILFLGLAVLALGVCVAAQQPSSPAKLTTVILVRHAERGPDEGISSPITEKGRERAQELARVLKDSGITRICVSEFIRTRQTVEPLAKLLKLEPETVPQQKGIDELAARIRKSKGETILVSSHRGRVEPLIEKLGGGKMVALGDAEYDNLLVLTIPESGAPKLVRLRYGAH